MSEIKPSTAPTGKPTSSNHTPIPNNPAQSSVAPQVAPQQKEHRASKADKFKFVGLIAFFVVMAIIIVLLWPYLTLVFQEDGIQRLLDKMDNAGIGGVFLLEALQFLQIVVAFIPGEIVQITAGMMYGPWLGALIILIGCILSSAFIFLLVHKLGAPFVHDMVPEKYLAKFQEFEKSRRFNVIIFILFLIPGLPKDVFTYITPLSDMKFSHFIAITNTARIPGIILSTYAANDLIDGNIWTSVGIFVVLALIAGIALVVFSKVTNKVSEKKQEHKQKKQSAK